MPDRDNTSMNAVKAAGLYAAEASPLVNPNLIELRNGDNAVLTRGQTGNGGVRIAIGAFPTHVGG